MFADSTAPCQGTETRGDFDFVEVPAYVFVMQQRELAKKKVGIALAAYDPEIVYFAEQLRSLQQQTYQNWICHICFDSPMEPVLEAPQLVPFLRDTRFRFHQNPIRFGYKKNFEQGLRLCLSEGLDYLAFSDQDDIWYPNKLALSIQALERMPPLSLVHTNFRLLEKPYRVSGQTGWEIENRAVDLQGQLIQLARNVANGCSMVFDAKLFSKYPKIPDTVLHHDAWFMALAQKVGRVKGISTPTFSYRQHGTNEIGFQGARGFFDLPTSSLSLGKKEYWPAVFTRWQAGYRETLGLCQSFCEMGLANQWSRLVVHAPDFGILFFLTGAVYVFVHRPTARTLIARGLGKFLLTIHGRESSLNA